MYLTPHRPVRCDLIFFKVAPSHLEIQLQWALIGKITLLAARCATDSFKSPQTPSLLSRCVESCLQKKTTEEQQW